MNISTISFKAAGNKTSIDIPSFVNNPKNRPYYNQSLQRTPSKDSFETTHKHPQKRTSNKKKNSVRKCVQGFAAGVAATMIFNFGMAQTKSVPSVVTIPYNDYYSIDEIAETYNADIAAILDYNNIENISELSSLEEIKIPSSYSASANKIEELQKKLYSSKLSDEERNEIEEQISILQEKQKLQDEIATVYTDGKYAYIQIKPESQDLSEEAQSVLSYTGINVETLKEVFDIEDGAIRKYNNLGRQWKPYEDRIPEGPSGYYDYTGNYISYGETIKVPLKSIGKN